MRFADCLKENFSPARPSKLRKPLLQAVAGIAGLAVLPFLSGSGSLAGQGLRVLAALAGASFLAFVALRWMAGRDRVARRPEMRVVSRASLSPKNGLALVEAEGQRFFIAYGDGFAQLLSCRPVDAEPQTSSSGDAP